MKSIHIVTYRITPKNIQRYIVKSTIDKINNKNVHITSKQGRKWEMEEWKTEGANRKQNIKW